MAHVFSCEIFEISKNTHFTEHLRATASIPRRYITNGEDVTITSRGERHIDISITTFGFCDQPQKISPSSCDTSKVSVLNDNFRENELALSEKKVKHVSHRR